MEADKFKKLYYLKHYKKLSDDLEPQIEPIRNRIRDLIEQEIIKLLPLLDQSTQNFESPVSETKEICHTILILNAHI
jgi:hypothetical protein